jgi:tRNA(Ile)-lysidine synthase TilS/MesJ
MWRNILSFCADSTVLAEILTLLNAKYDYGLELFLLSVDEGITGYRDDSLEVYHERYHASISLDGQEESSTVQDPVEDRFLQRTVWLDDG